MSVYLGFGLVAHVGEVSVAVDTAAFAYHAFDKVFFQHIFAHFKQCYFTFVNTAACSAGCGKIQALFFDGSAHCACKTAGMGKNSAVE